MKSANARRWTRTGRLLVMMLMPLIALSMTSCAVLKRKVIVIPADKTVTPLPAGEAYTPDIPGWFVPDARMQEIITELKAKP